MAANPAVPTHLAAEENSADLFADIETPAAETPGVESSLTISGEESLTVPIPADPENWNFGSEERSPVFSNLMGLEYRLGDAKFLSEWHADLGGYGAAGAGTDPWTDLLRITPGENYLSWAPGAFKFALGYQIFSWGPADGLNPTDNINPRDYSVGVQSSKIPILAAAATWYPASSVSLDAVYVPHEQRDIFPADVAAEIPAAAFYGYNLELSAAQIVELAAAIAADPPNQVTIIAQYLYANAADIQRVPVPFDRSVNETRLADDPSAFLAAGKLNFHGTVLDASLSYLYDIDPFYTPTITTAAYTVNETGMPLGPIGTFYRISSISLERKRIHRIGFDLKGSVGPIGFWLENAWSQNPDWKVDSYTARSPGLSSVLGLDANWGPENAFYANVQAMVQWYPWFDKSFGTDYAGGLPDSTGIADQAYMEEYYYRSFTQRLGGQTEGLNVGASLALKFPFAGDVVTPTLAAAYVMPFEYDDASVTRFGSLVLNPEIDIMPMDSFHIVIGASLDFAWVKSKSDGSISLDRTDNVGMYTPDNRVYIMARYVWNRSVGE
jgi:hypothetical protein